MGRQATDGVWLVLEGSCGTVSRMGVTSEHPLNIAGQTAATAQAA